jgi:hypothetical protein
VHSAACRERAKNAEEGNSVTELYLQAGPDTAELRAKVDLLEQVCQSSVVVLCCTVSSMRGSDLHVLQLAQSPTNCGSATPHQHAHLTALLDSILLLEMQVAGEPAYDTLRTKQQLGYSVHVGTRLTHGALGFCVTVASGGLMLIRFQILNSYTLDP